MENNIATKQKFKFFWGGTFSQWAPSIFILDDRRFTHAEQYMMYKKAILFSDIETAEKIMQADHPRQQKALGRTVKDFDKDLWSQHCKQFVYDANYAKFTQNTEMLKELMKTGDMELVEASPEDKIWGIGLAEEDPRAKNKETWQGLNWLGETLTKLREDLKKTPPIKEQISIDDFIKIDIRICEILSVEKIENKDKLYKLEINTGTEKRIVVSGIAQQFTPNQLLNKKFPFVLNLPPRKIGGILSDGMIMLSSGADGKYYAFGDENTEIGAIVV